MVHKNTMQDLIHFLDGIKVEKNITIGEIGTLIIIIFTLLVGVLYAYYTYKLWKESNFQTILSISPYIIFRINNDDTLYIKNIGNSTAFNVLIEPFIYIVKGKSIKQRKIYRLEFEEINIIESREEKELNYKTILPDGSINDNFGLAPHLNPRYQKNNNYLFTIRYTNIIGKKYFTKFYAGKDGIKIKEIGRTTLFKCMSQLLNHVICKIRMKIRL